MKNLLLKIIVCIVILGGMVVVIHAEEDTIKRKPPSMEEHNWEQSSVEYTIIEAGEHDYNYWKNFMKYTRTCQIHHRIKTVVYYCDKHDHTKSETTLEEIIHSHKHRMD